MKDYLAFERRILKKYTPQVPATANFMKLFEQLDYVDLAKEIDIIRGMVIRAGIMIMRHRQILRQSLALIIQL